MKPPGIEDMARQALVATLLASALISCVERRAPRIAAAFPRTVAGASQILELVPRDVPEGGVPQIAEWSVAPGADVARALDQAALFAADESIVGVVGHSGSRDALLGASIYNERGVPQIVPTATSSRLTEAGPWTFVLVPDNRQEGEFLAGSAVDSAGARRVTVFYLGDEYGAELRDGAAAGLRARGAALADAVLVPNAPCAGEWPQLLQVMVAASFRRAPPDAVILAIGSAGSGCLVEAVALASPGIPVFAADGFNPVAPGLDALSSDVRHNVRYVSFWEPGADSASRRFVARVDSLIKRPPTNFEALAYDAFHLLATAVAHAGHDRDRVRRYLESLGRSRPPFPGVTGPIAFSDRRRALPLRLLRLPGTS